MINGPSRVTAKSKSLMDHILCNDTEKICQSGARVISVRLGENSLNH